MADFLAVFADMSILAFGIGVLAGSEIEFVADIWFRRVGRWSARLPSVVGTLGFDAIRHDDGGIQPAEPVGVSEEEMLPAANLVPKGSVI